MINEDEFLDEMLNQRRHIRRFRQQRHPVAWLVENPLEMNEMDGDEFDLLRARNADNVSSALYHMMLEECTCKSLISSREVKCCERQVIHCSQFPDQAFYLHGGTGRTPLHEACFRGACPHVIRALLDANPRSSCEQDGAGNYPIHLLFVGHRNSKWEETAEIAQALLEVNPSHIAVSVNRDGSTPLDLACSLSLVPNSIIEILIQANPICASIVNNRRRTPLHVYICHGENHQVEGARTILQAYPEGSKVADMEGKLPLHMAACIRNVELLIFLLENCPEASGFLDNSSRTPLHELCNCPLSEVHLYPMQALIAAAPEALTISDSASMKTPLHIACSARTPYLEAIKLLATEESASIKDIDGFTALHHACQCNSDVSSIVKHLLTMSNVASKMQSRKKDLPLHIACSKNICAEVVQLLIISYPSALTVVNDYGFTPLHCACRAYQPKLGIVQAIVDACPLSVNLLTHGDETPIHLACSSGAFVNVLNLLTETQNRLIACEAENESSVKKVKKQTTSNVGNSPLHEACFRGASFEHIEALAKAAPDWIVARNNAHLTPLQVLCKIGRLDARVINLFSRLRGAEVFSVKDSTGHTPLHSACRDGTSLEAIKSLIQAYPDALFSKTIYGDTPLHLSCLRRASNEVIREIVLSSANGKRTTILETNTSGQTPIAIAIDDFQANFVHHCDDGSKVNPNHDRSFEVLSEFVKHYFYGTSRYAINSKSLLKACVSLHRKNVRLDPAFIQRVIQLYPEEVREIDDEGNYPLHIEASIPVEKMALLNGSVIRGCVGKCHLRTGVLNSLLTTFPDAAKLQNKAEDFPLGLMIQNGRPWDRTFSITLSHFPPALHLYKGMTKELLPYVLSKVSRECGPNTLFQVLISRPEIMSQNNKL
jgi:ankyrin repeat protein